MVTKMENKIIKELIKLSNKALKKKEVPVSAIITCNDKIIAKAYNKREKKNNVLGHAEILCIRKATKKLKNWKLTKCNLYVSLKPCSMCQEVIKQARIENVFYLLEKPEYKKEYNNTNFIKMENSKNKEFKKMLSSLFINKRK